MDGTLSWGIGRVRALPLAALAALLTCAGLTWPGSAGALPTPINFDEGRMDIAGFQDLDVLPGSNNALVTPDIDPGTGDFVIQPAGFDFDPYTASGLTVDVALNEAQSGHYDFATGAMTTQPASYTASVSFGTTDCTLTMPLAPTTEGPQPSERYKGQRFTPPLVPAVGAIVANWPTLPAPVGDPDCATFAPLVATPGGIWLGTAGTMPTREPVAGPTPGPGGTTTPPKKTCKKGQKLKKGKCVKKKKKKKK